MSDGWIKLHRKIESSEVFVNPNHFKLFIYLLLKVNREPSVVFGEELNIGQTVIGLKRLSVILGVPKSSLNKQLIWLEQRGYIITERKPQKTIITICNYILYQEKTSKNGETLSEHLANKKETLSEHLVNSLNDYTKTTYKDSKNDWETDKEHLGNKRCSKGETNKNKEVRSKNNKRVFAPDSVEYHLSVYLAEKIRVIDDVIKINDNNIQSWANEFRLMMQVDKRTHDYLKKIIDDVYEDSFWCKHIKSAGKLRQKINEGKLSHLKKDNQFNRNNQVPSDDAVKSLLAQVARCNNEG